MMMDVSKRSISYRRSSGPLECRTRTRTRTPVHPERWPACWDHRYSPTRIRCLLQWCLGRQIQGGVVHFNLKAVYQGVGGFVHRWMRCGAKWIYIDVWKMWCGMRYDAMDVMCDGCDVNWVVGDRRRPTRTQTRNDHLYPSFRYRTSSQSESWQSQWWANNH